jgi:acyl-coenzyme A thioesterase PaaI-like protein
MMRSGHERGTRTWPVGAGGAALLLAVVALLVASSSSPVETRATGSASLRVDPAEQVGGAQFTVNVIQNADVETGGVEVNVSFDRTLEGGPRVEVEAAG